MLPIDAILPGDCRTVLDSLPEQSIDLIFADPPYNLQLKNDLYRPNRTRVDAVDDDWDRFDDFEEYDRFTREWLAGCRRVLKDTGTLWVIGSYHNIYRVGALLLDLGFWILNDIAWVKTNPMPNFRGVRFTNAHESLLWVKRSREQKRYTFNYHAMKEWNGGKQMRSDWEIPLCTGSERLKRNGEKLHATQKPEELLHRVVLASSRPGDVVLDPFFGTGTTGAVAKRLHRRFIGIELDPVYIEEARRRIDRVIPASEEDLIDKKERRSLPRISFRSLVENGYITPGEILYLDGRDEVRAVVMADGTICRDGFRGSIHAVGARARGGVPCNGWEHWHTRDADGRYHSIDLLRGRARTESDGGSGDPAKGEKERSAR